MAKNNSTGVAAPVESNVEFGVMSLVFGGLGSAMLDLSVGHFIPVSRIGKVPSCRLKTRKFYQNRIRQ